MIVGMSRRICAELYREIAALRSAWHHDEDEQGALEVVMTGSASDPLQWQPHIRNKAGREALALRFRNPGDPFQIVIVREMWLTGFDATSLQTMYVDKPMRSHGLMQAIARVNRVFNDKPGGLFHGFDWTVRANVRAQLRVLVKRILRKYGYPPDKQEKATQTVLERAALFSAAWAAA
jgi:type I site-specific restriction-modification system R (restriction) subunit